MTAIRVKTDEEEPFYSVHSLAQKLAISDRTVRDVIRRGELPCYRIGQLCRIDPADVRRWLAERREQR
jgi:excisionase family DNA binding protein